jgi:DNA-binding LacI/PurR family transcriptional regulator
MRQAGVSAATAGRVLNSRATVRAKTMERAGDAIQILNHQP